MGLEATDLDVALKLAAEGAKQPERDRSGPGALMRPVPRRMLVAERCRLEHPAASKGLGG